MTGCLAQRYGDELAREIPEVDAFLGIESAPQVGKRRLRRPARTRQSRTGSLGKIPAGPPDPPAAHGERPGPPTSRFPKAATTPAPSAPSPAFGGVIAPSRWNGSSQEATQLSRESGALELNLVAQDTTAYGMDLYGRLALPELSGEGSAAVPGVQLAAAAVLLPDDGASAPDRRPARAPARHPVH